MNNLELINERKQKINEMCSELRWVFRGYHTSLFEFLPNMDIKEIKTFAQTVSKENKIFFSFFVSTILFIKLFCRSSDLNFYSLYKIAVTVDECFDSKKDFEETTYGIMCQPYVAQDNSSEEYLDFKEATLEFQKFYNNKEINRENFLKDFCLFLDEYLYDCERSFLIDDKFDISVKLLNRFISTAKHNFAHPILKED